MLGQSGHLLVVWWLLIRLIFFLLLQNQRNLCNPSNPRLWILVVYCYNYGANLSRIASIDCLCWLSSEYEPVPDAIAILSKPLA
ncbi:hypothetical protein [Dolichospermum compactum]|uniref:Uncharacterized protein n=1 Tax=Dolichospermum compactum NIES-806 TaxID=1973481 RepID=A0A1Z4UY41_9CYAN|nr:hypothetical protein [Dolichospermum compactum]BAZ84180.1 hypothetical protein NIES806_03640 [Dolichospermum compactum NIES-806]